MAKVALASSDFALTANFGTTYYIPLAITGSALQTTEAFSQITYRTAGTLSDIYTYISDNSINGTSTLRIRINGGNGTQVVSIGSSTTGHLTDATPTNTDTVAVADEINYSLVTGGSSGTALVRSIITNFSPSTNTFAQYANVNQTAQVLNTNNYWALAGSTGNNNTTEARAQTELNSGNVTFQNLFAYVSANTLTTLAAQVNFRDDGATAISISIAAGATGIFEETATSVTPATNSLIGIQTRALNSGTSITFEILAIGATSTDAMYMSPADNSNGSATSTSVGYFCLNGYGGAASTESTTQRQLRIGASISNVVVNVSANTANGTSSFAVRVDGSDSTCAASIGATSTGFFEDTDSVAVTASQLVNYSMTRGGTGTITSRSRDCMITNTETSTSIKDLIGGFIPFAR